MKRVIMFKAFKESLMILQGNQTLPISRSWLMKVIAQIDSSATFQIKFLIQRDR